LAVPNSDCRFTSAGGGETADVAGARGDGGGGVRVGVATAAPGEKMRLRPPSGDEAAAPPRLNIV
jgi:hypothetical protein